MFSKTGTEDSWSISITGLYVEDQKTDIFWISILQAFQDYFNYIELIVMHAGKTTRLSACRIWLSQKVKNQIIV